MRILSGKRAAGEVVRLSNRAAQHDAVEPQVRRIVGAIQSRGDRALLRYAQRWDGLPKGTPVRVPKREIEAAWRAAGTELRSSLRAAAANIRQFCEWQKPVEWTRTRKGISVGQLVRPLESVGCYVPGGRYPLVSTLLMTAIPAQVAGVKRIAVASPQPPAEVLAAAAMLEISEVYRVGGAQAIAAFAYGTERVQRVDKIVGPGNSYVTAAKKLVSFDCSIDMLAGPTEIVIISDAGDPQFIAADLVAQAEHDPETLAVFITTNRQLANDVASSARKAASKNAIARQSLSARGSVLVAESRRQALTWANQIAPEHITVDAGDVRSIVNAGSVFVGDYSPQSAGDYASGPNHVLPTGGAARFRGGLSVLDFVKLITVQKLSKPGLRQIAPVVTALATIEGLRAHADSVRVRCGHA